MSSGLLKRISGEAGQNSGQAQSEEPPAPIVDRKAVWDDFCADDELRRIYNIQPEELKSLSRSVMLGTFKSKEDLVFMLKVLRGKQHR
jgi:hypothetical protein